jgi:hypothetical protein
LPIATILAQLSHWQKETVLQNTKPKADYRATSIKTNESSLFSKEYKSMNDISNIQLWLQPLKELQKWS